MNAKFAAILSNGFYDLLHHLGMPATHTAAQCVLKRCSPTVGSI